MSDAGWVCMAIIAFFVCMAVSMGIDDHEKQETFRMCLEKHAPAECKELKP